MIIVTWIARAWAVLFVGAWAVIGVICGAQAVRDWWERSGRVIEDARKDVAIPGPGRPQPSGAGRDSDTRAHHWTPAQLAFIQGDTDSLPECTLPAPADIPEENPS